MFQEMIRSNFLGVVFPRSVFLFEECLETLRLDSRNTSPEYTLRGKEEQKRCKEDLHSHRLIFVDFFLMICVLLFAALCTRFGCFKMQIKS